ncbi:MAG: hypothetical protein K2X27_23925 [Candidatus Obscuribacterales bacterium]|nr:hypothetical protein [Candidatus Obscuribacterales bacterium]
MLKCSNLLALLAFCSLSSSTLALAEADLSQLAGHVNRGNNLMRNRQYAAAMAEYEAAKALDPKNAIVKQNMAECHNNMGISLYRRRSFADAIVEFEKCLQILPSHPQARRNISLCRQIMDREGIADTPSDPPDEPSEKPKAEAKASEKKEDSSPKIVGSSNDTTPSRASRGTYMSGSALFPVYTNKPTASAAQVLPTNAAIVKSDSPANASNAVPAASNAQDAAFKASLPSAAPAQAAAPDSAPASMPDSGAAAPVGIPYPVNVPSPGLSTPAPFASGPIDGSASIGANAVGSQLEKTAFPSQPQTESVQAASYGNTGISSPAANIASSSPNSAAPIEGLTVEDKLSALELKVYGKKHTQLPLIKRIEQLETEYLGQIRQGSMKERVEFLRNSIAQN